MTKKLYVDFKSPDGSIAVTNNNASYHHNLLVLGKWGTEYSPCFTAGKYVCFETKMDQQPVIFFLDFKANPENVKMFLRSEEPSPTFKTQLLSLIEVVNADYERLKDDYILIEGPSPATIRL